MEKTAREMFIEQKLAENVLRTANYELMAETARSKGRIFEAKDYEQRVKKLNAEHEKLTNRLEEKPQVETSVEEYWRNEAIKAQEAIRYSVPSTYLMGTCEQYGIDYKIMDKMLNDYFGFDGDGGHGRE